MISEKSLDNLKPFQKGHVGMGGRPKGSISVLTELKRLLKKKISYEDPTTKLQVKGKIARAIALRHVYNALEGEGQAIIDIFDRIDGRIANRNENVNTERRIIIEVGKGADATPRLSGKILQE